MKTLIFLFIIFGFFGQSVYHKLERRQGEDPHVQVNVTTPKSQTPSTPSQNPTRTVSSSQSSATTPTTETQTPGAVPTQPSYQNPTALSGWSAYLSTSGNYANSPWASSVRNSGVEASVGRILPYVNAVSVETKGLESARQQSHVDAYMASFFTDSGASWRDGMYTRTLSLIDAQKKYGHTIAWQIGNEINSVHYKNTLDAWSAANSSKKLSGDPIIPYYVEYYLAPSVEGIRRAEAATSVDIPIGLGSIAGAYNPTNRAWLDSLLSYKIIGTYAPTLAGKTVADIIEIITLHYIVTNDDDWEKSLDMMWKRWNGVGTVRGIWSTEEQGGKAGGGGRGASTEVRVFARYTKWWIKNGLDSQKGWVSFWGPELTGSGGSATSGNYGLGLINSFFGSKTGKIIDLSKSLTLGDITGTFESYLFGNTTVSNKLLLIIAPNKHLSSMTAKSASFSVSGWTGSVKATAHLLSATGDAQSAPVVTQSGSVYTVTFPTTLSLAGTEADQPTYLLLLEKN